MTTTNFGSNRRATQSAVTARKSRVRQQNNGIVENVFIPVEVNEAEDGGVSKMGNYSTYFDLKVLSTGATFKTCVFGSSLPNSVESKILNCTLPPKVNNYELEDLIGGAFEVLLKFNTKDDKSYINIIDVQPLQSQHRKLLKQQQQNDQLAKHQTASAIEEFEDEMNEDDIHEATQPNSSHQIKSDNKVKQPLTEDDELDLDIDEEDLDLDFEEDDELVSDDDTCLYCDGLGCEMCDDE